MKVAIIGSRNLEIENLEKYLPENTIEIVSGGAKGIDCCAKNYAIQHNMKLTEFLPQYNMYGKGAPIKRNMEIIDYSDIIVAFWDGKSKGTKFVIESTQKLNKPILIYLADENADFSLIEYKSAVKKKT